MILHEEKVAYKDFTITLCIYEGYSKCFDRIEKEAYFYIKGNKSNQVRPLRLPIQDNAKVDDELLSCLRKWAMDWCDNEGGYLNKVIEGLERLKEIKSILYEELTFHKDVDELINPIEEELKALEVIIRNAKIVNYSVNNGIVGDELIIFQGFQIKNVEDYDLLKKVVKYERK